MNLEEKISALTKEILFGMNLLTLAGFLVMGLSLTLHRTGNAGGTIEHRPYERWNGSGALRAAYDELITITATKLL